MSAKSLIGWTEATWNPILGCSKCSPGCKHCYAILDVHRMAGNPNPKIKAANEGLTILQGGELNWTGKLRLIPERLDIPLRRRKPTIYFVNSLSDLFHEDLSDEDIDKVFASMALAPQHTFQVLTKRAERLPQYFSSDCLASRIACFQWGIVEDRVDPLDRRSDDIRATALDPDEDWPLPNVWLGVSIESRAYKFRIDRLRETPAAVRFLSLEPLLEDLGELDLTGIDWVIVGGESGKGARPMNPAWVRNIQRQCAAQGVRFFFKQWGNYHPAELTGKGTVTTKDGKVRETVTYALPSYCGSKWGPLEHVGCLGANDPNKAPMVRVGKKKAGRLLDGRTWDEMPEVCARSRAR